MDSSPPPCPVRAAHSLAPAWPDFIREWYVVPGILAGPREALPLPSNRQTSADTKTCLRKEVLPCH
ncbi:hypothetical protein Desku_0017 [Desulfofundulus kuznetsovii DSM 6115]|jgi:hypothetical protein|uniref:Uncharacterized protein n=1 Tax=Desulfofundulus kuznetsovii (strain DSM 6115 / VKM B-1805 / 17) TaxID=760568 RepID=A0AAU8P7P2_DESK7|nr:hypothetical protein Desku_0017 [Desulfofundulus kuznetsovii DSM 6115]